MELTPMASSLQLQGSIIKTNQMSNSMSIILEKHSKQTANSRTLTNIIVKIQIMIASQI